MRFPAFFSILLVIYTNANSLFAQTRQVNNGRLITDTITSAILRENKIGLDVNRSTKIYLPPGYENSKKSYPVVYYCHGNSSTPEQLFADGILIRLLEKGFANRIIEELIVVSASYGTPTGGSLYENSSTSGRWLDFTARELIPFIDSHYRTLRHRDSRALAGDFIGGRGALKLAMVYADIFSVVYALHAVATGIGYLPWASNLVDWKKIHQAKNFAELPAGREHKCLCQWPRRFYQTLPALLFTVISG